MNVVVVESPAKAKTIEKYLGSGYKVVATYGHVCDLPSKDGSVRPDEGFAMDYVSDAKAEKNLKAIARALGDDDALLLATDPDREGEAISWHVLNYVNRRRRLDDSRVRRVVFHEITRDAVREAFAHPREIDMDLVNAQQARRALDYLVGFNLSPVLWRKLPGARSAGRVQSVALRLICAREQEIEAFVAREYWTVDADFATPAGGKLAARLTHLDGAKLSKFTLGDEAAAQAAVAAVTAHDYRVAKVARKQVRRNPAPPFITSTLQQEASRKLGMTAQRTMRVAQRLYEGVEIGGEMVGLITYMRTDSVTLSNEALAATRAVIRDAYGAAYLPDEPRRYRTKARNAQEAHEAIRPTDPGRRARDIAGQLEPDQLRLYELIWRRTIACQMASARLDQVAVDIAAPGDAVVLRATGSVVAFDGFMRVYREGRDDPAPGDDAEDSSDRRLPPVDEGQAMTRGPVRPEQHFTEPPPRYSEATLVRKMEELGIGRPSTYASIISVLQDRDYVRLEKKRFMPEGRGRLVTAFLESFFERYVRYDFTADLEDQLDRVSNGELDWKAVLDEFWSAFSMAVTEIGDVRVKEVLDRLNEVLGPHIFPDDGSGADARACPTCETGQVSLKVGRFGAFVGCSNYPECRYTRQIAAGADGNGQAAAEGSRSLGVDAGGNDVTVRKGPYGFYVQSGAGEDGAKPRRVSLPKDATPDAVTLETAVALLGLPRDVGAHPETGKTITAGIGRYGPYLKHDGRYKSLPDGDDVLAVGLNRAVSLLAEPSRGRGGAVPVRVLGAHPDDGADIGVYEGRYGPYIKHNGVIANIPKDTPPDQVTVEQAVPLLAEKAKKKKGAKRKPAAKAKARSKSTAKKAAKKTVGAKRKPATKADQPAEGV
ncbi:MAG: type I DNA topoisomerase [Alphaproteobacteria bacterium]|jgi:DNA topoisomerase-1|nr:type I DNA topoisomerase [Alphaproteobacteria bacterium]MDP6515732.1 type I DNA topoisomerase [Alphaproteobacteria bacterium]